MLFVYHTSFLESRRPRCSRDRLCFQKMRLQCAISEKQVTCHGSTYGRRVPNFEVEETVILFMDYLSERTLFIFTFLSVTRIM